MTKQIEWSLKHKIIDYCFRKGKPTYSAAQIQKLLRKEGVELTHTHVSNLISKKPSRVSLKVVAGFCAILNCTPEDILVLR